MYDKFNGGGGKMNYVEQFYSTNIKLRAFEDALAEAMVLTKIFVTKHRVFVHLNKSGPVIVMYGFHSNHCYRCIHARASKIV